RVDDLFIVRLGVVIVAQPKKLRDAFHFVLGSRGKLPVLKGFIGIAARMGCAVTAEHFRRVIVRIEADRKQMRLIVSLGLLLQSLIDGGEVVTHQGALIGLKTTGVDESQQERLAAILRQMNSFAILIDEAKVRNLGAGFW